MLPNVFGLSSRTYNTLNAYASRFLDKRPEMLTPADIEEVAAHADEELLIGRGIGPTALAEIRAKVPNGTEVMSREDREFINRIKAARPVECVVISRRDADEYRERVIELTLDVTLPSGRTDSVRIEIPMTDAESVLKYVET